MNIIRETQSICPECNKVLPAKIFERDGKVWIKRECQDHGKVEELYWGSYDMYLKASKFSLEGKGIENPSIKKEVINCPSDCGLCKDHITHTTLANMVITNRCDLSCWYCLPSDEEVMVQTKDGVFLKKVEELFEDNLDNSGENTPFGQFLIPSDLEVLSWKDGKATWVKVDKLFKRKFTGSFWKVKTLSGKEITTTEDHRFIVLENGSLTRKSVSELKPSDKLISLWSWPSEGVLMEVSLIKEFDVLPQQDKGKVYVREFRGYLDNLASEKTLRQIFNDIGISSSNIYLWRSRNSMPLTTFSPLLKKYPEDVEDIVFGVNATTSTLPNRLVITPQFAKLIGYFIADGHYTSKDLRITVSDVQERAEIETCIRGLGIDYSILNLSKFGKVSQVVIGSRLMRSIFLHVFKIPPKAANKRLPKFAFSLPKEIQRALLSGLFNGDGYASRGKRHAFIGLATVSKGLARDIIYMLASFGVFCRLYVISKEKVPMAKHDLYKIYIAGRDMLKLVSLLDLKTSHLEKLKGLGPRKDSKVQRIGDFIVDEVKEIQRVELKEQYVYDLEVDDDMHTFIAGDGILISNCFFYAERAGYIYEPSLEQIREMARNLRNERPVPGNAIQLTGGEPCLREDLIEIIKAIKEEGIEHVQLNTDGIRLATDPTLAKRVREAGTNTVYLSFDGLTPKTNFKNHWEIPSILENCRSAGLGIVLVPTVIKSINDHEAGDIIDFASKNIDVIRGVNFQPVSLTGRLTRAERNKYRITIPDLIQRIEEQTNGEIKKEDFYSVPCTGSVTRFVEALTGRAHYDLSVHFACGAATYVFKEDDRLIPITRFVDIDGLFEYLSEKADEIKRGKNRYWVAIKVLSRLGKFIDKEKQPKGLNLSKIIFNILIRHNYDALGEFHHKTLLIGMMHFMDKYNYDMERLRRCGIHYLVPNGLIIPFCAFNVVPEWYRDKIQKEFGTSIEEWEKRTGRKIKDDFYIRKVEHEELAEPRIV